MASLGDRISKPESSRAEGNDQTAATATANSFSTGMNVTATPFVPGLSRSSADVTLEAETNHEPSAAKDKAQEEMSSLSEAQTDGATEPQGGASGIYEPSYDVNVKLSDLQANPDDPLYSIKSFEELGL